MPESSNIQSVRSVDQDLSVAVLLTRWTILCHGRCPVHGRVFSSIPGSYSLHAVSSSFLVVTIKNISRHCQQSPGGQDHPWWRTAGTEETEVPTLGLACNSVFQTANHSVPAKARG